MQWESIEAAAEAGMTSVDRGFTEARRGIVAVPETGERYFVKIAVNEQTQHWLEQELHAYDWLEQHNYPYAPRVVARGSDGFALPDLSDWDWRSTWSSEKLDAALRAMDCLADLSSEAAKDFTPGPFSENPWTELSESAAYEHIPAITPAMLAEARDILQSGKRQRYEELAAVKPFSGMDLVHGDVRADNFAYNPASGAGLLVDWNWVGLGSKAFDQTAFLVDVHKRFDVFASGYADRLDRPSLAWLIGYWLHAAAEAPEKPYLEKLRFFQLESALRADRMCQQLTR